MKPKLLLIIFLFVFNLNAQEQVQFIKRGVLTLKNNEKVEFSNLVYEKDKVTYTNSKTQQTDHLFLDSILSIDEGEIEFVNKSEINQKNNGLNLPDGAYYTFDYLKKSLSKSENYKPIEKNSKRQFYYLENEKGEKVRNILAFVKDGELYIRGKGIKEYMNKKKSLSFRGNQKIFVKMTKQNGLYVAKAPFTNNTVSIIGAIVSGVAGGLLAPGVGSAVAIGAGGASLFWFVSQAEKEIVVDLESDHIYLR